MSYPAMIGSTVPISTSGNRATSGWPLYVTSNNKLHRHSRNMAYEERDEAKFLYISYMVYMIITQTRCTIAACNDFRGKTPPSFYFRLTASGKKSRACVVEIVVELLSLWRTSEFSVWIKSHLITRSMEKKAKAFSLELWIVNPYVQNRRGGYLHLQQS